MVSFSAFETISRKLDFERYLVNGIKSFTITDAAANKLERLSSIFFKADDYKSGAPYGA